MPVPRIRQAQRNDRAAWMHLRRSLWPHCSEQKHNLEMGQLLKSDGVVFVAENDQAELIGFAEVSLRQDHVDGASISPVPYLEAWFVEASFRKQGVGRALIGAVERWATSRGYSVDVKLAGTAQSYMTDWKLASSRARTSGWTAGCMSRRPIRLSAKPECSCWRGSSRRSRNWTKKNEQESPERATYLLENDHFE
jgi:aminoglycoside 6'-N-acetyltransferase I